MFIKIMTYLICIVDYSFGKMKTCESIKCSNVFDPICGSTRFIHNIISINKYHNVCHLKKTKCKLKYLADIKEIPDVMCNIRKKKHASGRRIFDFSIVGSYQTCNHTCPTYCTDVYDPACAQIWKQGMSSFDYRPMINHCHIDLFSCAVGVNVTIRPLSKCYKNPSGLQFMTQVAALKSLKLIDDKPVEHPIDKFLSQPIASLS